MPAYRWRQVATNPNLVQCDSTKVYGQWLANPRRIEPILCSVCHKPAKVDLACSTLSFYCFNLCPIPIAIKDRVDLSWWQKLTRGIK